MKRFILTALSIAILSINPAFAGGGGDEKKADGVIKPYEFVQIDPVILPIIGHNGATQSVSIVITLEFYNAKDAEKAGEIKPRLSDAFLTRLYGNVSHIAMKAGMPVVNIMQVKHDLHEASAKVLGEEVKHDVLVEVLQQQKI